MNPTAEVAKAIVDAVAAGVVMVVLVVQVTRAVGFLSSWYLDCGCQ